ALVRAEQAEGKIDSALSNVELLLREDPTKREYLETAADLEIARYLGNRSYLNELGPQKGLAYLHRLLESGGESQAQVYRKIAYVYVAERDYQTALSYLEQAAERATQEGKEAFPADHLWIEAAEIALRMPELQKAQDYARKALASNSTSHAAKRILQQLSPLR
ncbi:MAG: tetratricopeptide repeat protein, partial [Candidatus Entotheonellia bacterium]